MTARALAGLVGLYQLALRPLMRPACRFHPSCSDYAREALLRHGLLRGLRLSAARLLRCQPLCAGGYDAVPQPRG